MFNRYRKFIVLTAFLVLAPTVLAQPGTTNPPSAWVALPNVTLTTSAYWKAQDPAVQKLWGMPSGKDRDDAALALAKAGFVIDVPIMAWNWDPVTTMYVRQQLGFTWVSSGLQPQSAGQGTPPAGTVRVSTDIADYPPSQTGPPPPVQATNIVGARVYDNVYTYGPGAVKNGSFAVQNGQQITQDGKTYTAHVSATLMGTTVYFTQP